MENNDNLTNLYYFCCADTTCDACNRLVFKTTRSHEHLYCPTCGGALVLQKQLEHEEKEKENLIKHKLEIEQLIAKYQTQHENYDFCENLFFANGLEYRKQHEHRRTPEPSCTPHKDHKESEDKQTA